MKLNFDRYGEYICSRVFKSWGMKNPETPEFKNEWDRLFYNDYTINNSNGWSNPKLTIPKLLDCMNRFNIKIREEL